jgi:hypothetical protein
MPETVTKAILNYIDVICHNLINARDIHLLQTRPVTEAQFFIFIDTWSRIIYMA